jgi:hypothetical protein
MNVLVSPEFNQKLSVLNSEDIQSISDFISTVEDLSQNELLTTSSLKISAISDDIYIAKLSSNSRLFFTLGEDYLVLIDVTSIQSHTSINTESFYTFNNPKTNESLNPKFNSSINPKFNSSINPKFNSSINPKFNSSINPKFNSSINPKMNSSYGGPFAYDLNMNQISYIVKTGNHVDIIYSTKIEWIGFFVEVNDNIKLEFDLDNNWIGYLVRANDQVWLRYSLSDEWIGLFV